MSGWPRKPVSVDGGRAGLQPTIPLQDGLKLLVRECEEAPTVRTGHGPRGDEGVHDRLLARLHDPLEERVQIGVRYRSDRRRMSFVRIVRDHGGGKTDHEI